MPTLVVPAKLVQCQISDFPAKCARSKNRKGEPTKGALYIRPASTMRITDAEWKHLQENHADLAKLLILVPDAPSLNARLAARAKKEKDPKVKAKIEAALAAKPAPKPAPEKPEPKKPKKKPTE